MEKLIVTYIPNKDSEYKRGFSCEFELSDEAPIWEIHRTLKMIPRLMTYSEASIEKHFGEDCYD